MREEYLVQRIRADQQYISRMVPLELQNDLEQFGLFGEICLAAGVNLDRIVDTIAKLAQVLREQLLPVFIATTRSFRGKEALFLICSSKARDIARVIEMRHRNGVIGNEVAIARRGTGSSPTGVHP
jgi:hypothetical protein